VVGRRRGARFAKGEGQNDREVKKVVLSCARARSKSKALITFKEEKMFPIFRNPAEKKRLEKKCKRSNEYSVPLPTTESDSSSSKIGGGPTESKNRGLPALEANVIWFRVSKTGGKD